MSNLIEKLEAWARTPRVKMSGVQHKDAAEMLDLLRRLVEAADKIEDGVGLGHLYDALADLRAKLEAK